jgi:protein ImuA
MSFSSADSLPEGLQPLSTLDPARHAAWRPGRVDEGVPHAEVFASTRDGAGGAFALALALDRIAAAAPDPLADTPDERAWLWVQDRTAIAKTGRPYRPGLPPSLRHRLIHVSAKDAADVLFTIEEGLRCRDLAFVIGEIAGNPKALSFTASRRLSLAAEKHGVPLWLVRLDAARELSSARMRWQVSPAPSAPPRWNAQAPGSPAWRAELFRARSHPPGEWLLGGEGGRLAFNSAVRPEELSSLSRRRLEGQADSATRYAKRLAGVGEGFARLRARHTPLQASLALGRASSVILAPSGERNRA